MLEHGFAVNVAVEVEQTERECRKRRRDPHCDLEWSGRSECADSVLLMYMLSCIRSVRLSHFSTFRFAQCHRRLSQIYGYWLWEGEPCAGQILSCNCWCKLQVRFTHSSYKLQRNPDFVSRWEWPLASILKYNIIIYTYIENSLLLRGCA